MGKYTSVIWNFWWGNIKQKYKVNGNMFRLTRELSPGKPHLNIYTGNQQSFVSRSQEEVWDLFTSVLLYWNSLFLNKIFQGSLEYLLYGVPFY